MILFIYVLCVYLCMCFNIIISFLFHSNFTFHKSSILAFSFSFYSHMGSYFFFFFFYLRWMTKSYCNTYRIVDISAEMLRDTHEVNWEVNVLLCVSLTNLAAYCFAHQVPQVWREEQRMLSEQEDSDFSVPFTWYCLFCSA